MSIAIKEAVKIAYDEAVSHGGAVIPHCWEGPYGWDFDLASRDFTLVPGAGSFRVLRSGDSGEFFHSRSSAEPPPPRSPEEHKIDIKPILAELGEPYISLRKAVKIARDKIDSFPKGPPPPLSFTIAPECGDMEGTGWRFFFIADLTPDRFVSLTVSCYGEASERLMWDDLPLPDISEYEDSGYRKVDISEYLAEMR